MNPNLWSRYFINFIFIFISLTSCSSYSPTSEMIGLPSDVVIQRMGSPTMKISDDDGLRLFFARGPFGKHTYVMYFSSEDRLIRSEQVLTEPIFSLIKPGMTKEEVINLVGPPKIMMGGRKSSWTVWSYRYENSLCRWFQVEFTPVDLVKSAEYGRPPECNVRAPRAIHGR